MRLRGRAAPQTEEVGLKMITTAKISNMFSLESPYISNTFSQEYPKFQTSFHASKRTPRRSKDLSGKLIDLKMQIFEVRSPRSLSRVEEAVRHSS